MIDGFDVIIAGAGPAGLKCAEILASNGKKVLVLEKGKEIGKKVCAGCLTLKDLELRIPKKIIQRKFKRLLIHTALQDTEMKLDEPFLATIGRKDLGQWMADKARRAGAEIRTNSQVTNISENHIIVNKKEKIKYSYLVGADGSNSFVRRYLNIKTEKFLEAFQYITKKKFKDIQVFINPEKFGSLYLWIFPHRNFTSVGSGGDLARNVNQILKISDIRENFKEWCEERFDTKKANFQSAIINYDYRGYDFSNKFLIGDAGGFASGLTGEGIYNAIKSGEDVAYKILDKNYDCKNIKHILRVKEVEEALLRHIEINKTFTKIQWEIVTMLLKIKFIDKEVISLL